MRKHRGMSIILALFLLVILGTSSIFAQDLDVDKNISWTAGSNTSEVSIYTDVPTGGESKVLFLGTLCSAHSMDSGVIEKSIDAIRQNADIDYYLFSKDSGNGLNTNLAASGSLKRNSISKITVPSLSGGNHSALAGFFNTLYDLLYTGNKGYGKEGGYDYIVLEFDGTRIAQGFDSTSNSQGTTFTDQFKYDTTKIDAIATELKKYYDANRVIWITDGRVYDGSSSYTKTDGYFPTSRYFYSSDGKIGYLTPYKFRSLCALVAPDYYQAHTQYTDTTYYGDGKSTSANTVINLTDKALTMVERDAQQKIKAESYVTARQLSYADASELENFLYMAIHGIDVNFTDSIKVEGNATIKNVKVYYTQDDTRSTASWTQAHTYDVPSDYKTSGATSGDSTDVTSGMTTNITVSIDNTVTVVANDVKRKNKHLKITITLESSNGFVDCYELSTAGSTSGKYVMNPNDGPAKVVATIGSGTAEGEQPAEAPTLFKVTSTVSEGTQAAGANVEAKVMTPSTAAQQEAAVASLGTVQQIFTPKAGYSLKKITIDGSEVTLGADGTASGTGYTVSKNATTGVVTATFANVNADHTADVQFQYGLSITKTVTSPASTVTVHGGDDITYTITVKNDTETAVTGYTVTDALESNLTYKSSATSSTTGSVDYDATTKTVTGTDLTIPATGSTTITIVATVNATIKEATTVNNTVSGKGGEEDPEITPEDPPKTPVQPKQLTVEYKINGKKDTTAYPDKNTDYGAQYTAEAGPSDPGYVFDGWYTDPEYKTKFVDKTELTDNTTLYGKYTYGVSIAKAQTSPATTATVRGGDEITYTITVKNDSAKAVTGFKVSDTLESNLTYKSSSTTSTAGRVDYDDTTKTVTGTNLTIPANGSITVTIKATVSDTITAATTVKNTVSGKGSEDDDPEITPENPPETPVQPKQLTVEYKINGKKDTTKYPDKNTNYGAQYTAEEGPSDPGYVFDGWYTNPECETKYVDKTTLTSDTTLYGKYTYGVSIAKAQTSPATTATVYGGDDITYTITITNTSGKDVTGFKVSDTLESNLTYKSSSTTSTTGNVDYDDTTKIVSGTGLTIPANESITVTIIATVSDTIAADTVVKNTVSGKGSEDDDPEIKPEDPVETPVKPIPSTFKVTKEAYYNGEKLKEDEKVFSNSTVTYKINVTNKDKNSTKNVEFVDEVPAGLTNISNISDSGVYDENTGKITWNLDIAKEATKTVSFNATITPTLAAIGEIENEAYVTKCDSVDYEGPGDKNDPGKVKFTAVPVKVITITKDWSDSWANHASDSVKFNVYANGTLLESVSPVTIDKDNKSKVILVDAVDADGQAINYTFKEVDLADPTKEVAKGGLNGLYKFDYTDTSDEGIPTANSTIAVTNTYQVQLGDLTIEKVTDPEITSIEPGAEFTYKITVKNTRLYETASDIVIEDIVPEGLIIEGTSLEDETDIDGQKVTWTVASLAPDTQATLKIYVSVPEDVTAAEYTNVANIISLGDTPAPEPKPSTPVVTTLRSFTANKIWCDSKGNKITDTADFPAVKVTLLQNGEEYDVVYLIADDGWTYTWDDLPLLDASKVPYSYTVEEDDVEGYTGKADYKPCKDAKYGDGAADITNTLKTINVEYKDAGEVPSGLTPTSTEKVDYGTEYKAKDLPKSPENYKVEGWFIDPECTIPYVDGTKLDDETAAGGTITLYAKWNYVAPKTGDSSSPVLWICLMGVALLAIAGVVIFRIRAKKINK